jgi:hypothetical protein
MTPELRDGLERIAALPKTLERIADNFAASLKAAENEALEKARLLLREQKANSK